jgi:hypothetical protein
MMIPAGFIYVSSFIYESENVDDTVTDTQLVSATLPCFLFILYINIFTSPTPAAEP